MSRYISIAWNSTSYDIINFFYKMPNNFGMTEFRNLICYTFPTWNITFSPKMQKYTGCPIRNNCSDWERENITTIFN